jgi:uncharacterized protein YkvS
VAFLSPFFLPLITNKNSKMAKRSSNDQAQGSFLEPAIYEPFNLIAVKTDITKESKDKNGNVIPGSLYITYLFKAKEGIHPHQIFKPTKPDKGFKQEDLTEVEKIKALDKKINKAADDMTGIAERITGNEVIIDLEYGDDFNDDVWESMVQAAQNFLPVEYARVDMIGKLVVNLFGKQPKVQLPHFIKSGLIRADEKDKQGNPRKLYYAKAESADIEKYNKARALQTNQTQVDDKIADDAAAAFISKRRQIKTDIPQAEALPMDDEPPFDFPSDFEEPKKGEEATGETEAVEEPTV